MPAPCRPPRSCHGVRLLLRLCTPGDMKSPRTPPSAKLGRIHCNDTAKWPLGRKPTAVLLRAGRLPGGEAPAAAEAEGRGRDCARTYPAPEAEPGSRRPLPLGSKPRAPPGHRQRPTPACLTRLPHLASPACHGDLTEETAAPLLVRRRSRSRCPAVAPAGVCGPPPSAHTRATTRQAPRVPGFVIGGSQLSRGPAGTTGRPLHAGRGPACRARHGQEAGTIATPSEDVLAHTGILDPAHSGAT